MKPRLHSWMTWAAPLLVPLVLVSTSLLAQTTAPTTRASAQPARITHTYTLSHGMPLDTMTKGAPFSTKCRAWRAWVAKAPGP